MNGTFQLEQIFSQVRPLDFNQEYRFIVSYISLFTVMAINVVLVCFDLVFQE